jgi:hypothetical protein
MKPGLINRIEKVLAAAEAELELADAPLTLCALEQLAREAHLGA